MSSKYKSKFSPGKLVSINQYLSELMCERIAQHENIDLPDQFWKVEKWRKIFIKHTTQIARLKKHFDEQAILDAFNDKYAYQYESFGDSRFKAIVAKYHKQINSEELRETKGADKIEPPRKPKGNPSIITKLSRIDKHDR